MAKAKKNPLARLVGEEIEFTDGRKAKITAVHDYEPPDRSVGIWVGYVTVTCDDGVDYDILDNGDVQTAESNGKDPIIGKTGELWHGDE